MIRKLTKEQVDLMYEVRDDWIRLALRSGKDVSADEIEDYVKWMYDKIGLKKPEIYVSDSMLARTMRIIAEKEVGEWVGEWVGGQVRKRVGKSVGEQVEEQVWERVGGQVRKRVWERVWGQVREQVEEQVWERVWGQVRERVWERVWGQVGERLLDPFYYSFGLGNESGWLSFYDYFSLIGVVNNEDFFRYRDMMRKGVWEVVFYEKAVFVSKLPIKVLRDAENNLHSLDEPAVQWRDGNANYFIHGVGFDKKLWEGVSEKKLSVMDVMKLPNIEQRCAVLRDYGDRIFEELRCVLVDSSERGNELYQTYIEIGERNVILKLLRYMDPSTGRVYISYVPPEIERADQAMAWKFGMTEQEYAMLRIES